MNDLASIHIRAAIETLLKAHSLSTMHGATGNKSYATGSLAWFETIQDSLDSARGELEKAAKP